MEAQSRSRGLHEVQEDEGLGTKEGMRGSERRGCMAWTFGLAIDPSSHSLSSLGTRRVGELR